MKKNKRVVITLKMAIADGLNINYKEVAETVEELENMAASFGYILGEIEVSEEEYE